MNALLATSSAEAVSPAASTTEPWPKTMPLELMRNRWPFEVSVPFRIEGSQPSTRFSVAEAASGTTKLARSPTAIENDCQSITARLELCTIVVSPGVEFCIKASPRTTTPPSGFAKHKVPMQAAQNPSPDRIRARPLRKNGYPGTMNRLIAGACRQTPFQEAR